MVYTVKQASDEIKKQIDLIHYARQKRDMIAATHDDKIKRMTSLLETFMRATKIASVKSENASASFRQVKAVGVDDWAKVFSFVEENNAYDILQKRITPTAVQARLDAGEVIPGVTVESHTEFVVRALPKKGEGKSDGT